MSDQPPTTASPGRSGAKNSPTGEILTVMADIVKSLISGRGVKSVHLPILFSMVGITVLVVLGLGGAIHKLTRGDDTAAKHAPQIAQLPRAAKVAARPPRPDPAPRFNALDNQIKLLEQRLAGLRRQLDSLGSSDQLLARRVTSLESTFGTLTASIDKQVVHLPGKRRVARRGRPLPPLAALPPDSSTAETISATVGRDSDIPELSATSFGLYLATHPDGATLNAHWRTLKARYGKLFKGLKPHVTRTDKKKRARRLIAGPIKNAAQAARLCVKLKSDGKFCHQIVFPAALAATAKRTR